MLKRILTTMLSALLVAGTLFPASAASAPVASGETNNYTSTCEWLDDTFAYDGKLGADYSPTSTTFRVWAPVATKITLKRYATGSDREDGAKSLGDYPMTKNSSTGVWSVTVDGDLVNTYYTYEITTPDVMGRDPKTHETQDIYSYAVGVNGDRSMVVDFDNTDPEGWDQDNHVLLTNPTDSFVWEVHIKDFSYDPSSGVSEANRGKYLAFTETGTTVNGKGGMATCVDYLKNLGVTTVQINPFNDFGSVDETDSAGRFNWGYDPKNYSVPDGSYSSNPYDGNVRIKECKQMIQALHNAGISVVMDVVYNHTYSTDSCFNYTVPKYYYRMWHERNADGSVYYDSYVYSNGSGCGNETASERRMYRKFMIDSILNWAKEYHVDGFRFDLMALHDVETLNAIRKALDEQVDSHITMWGEGWTGGGGEYPGLTWDKKPFVQANIGYHPGLDQRIGFFNDGLRDAIRGNNDLNVAGWIQTGDDSNNWKVAEGMKAEKGDSFSVPTQVVSYAACHDNRTLWDQLCASQGMTESYYKRNEKLISQSKLSGAVLNVSQGATFILAGEEMGRSKGGDHNSYNKPPEINKIDWNLAQTNSDLVSYYKGLRQIRNNFALFKSPARTSDKYYFLPISTKDQIACICTNTQSGQWNKLLCIANASDMPITYQVPSGQEQNWIILSDGSKAGLKSLGEVPNGNFSVPANSMVIAVDKASYNSVNIDDPTRTIDVHFENKATGEWIYSYSVSGDKGKPYSIYAPEVYDNSYILDSVIGDTEGTFSENGSVTVNYIPVNAGTVTVKYLKTGTNESIRNDDVLKAVVGDTITLGDPPPMLGYKANDSQNPTDSKIPVVWGNTDVKYYYDEATRNIKLHFRHSGSETWAPVLWIWGDGSYNYGTSKEWPGDTLTDTDGDGWFDTSFTARATETSYNLIVSSDHSRTMDITGLADSELWIVIDDSNIAYDNDHLIIYRENPDTNPNAHKAGRYGKLNSSSDNIEPTLYNITKENFFNVTVSGYNAEKTIPGAEVIVSLDRKALPNGSIFKSFSVNDGKVEFNTLSDESISFTMPEENVVIKAVMEAVRPELTLVYAVDPSCEEDGNTAYYIDAAGNLYEDEDYTPLRDKNGDGKVDLNDVKNPAKGHSWNEPVWTWNDNYTSAKAAFTCKNDTEHTTDGDAVITKEVTTSDDGVITTTTYTATVTLNNRMYTDTKTETDIDSSTPYDTDSSGYEEMAYKIYFNMYNADINVYRTSNAEYPYEHDVKTAWSRDGKTGELDKSGSGEITFEITNESSDDKVRTGIIVKGDYDQCLARDKYGRRYTITGIKSDLTITADYGDDTSTDTTTNTDTDTSSATDTSTSTDVQTDTETNNDTDTATNTDSDDDDYSDMAYKIMFDIWTADVDVYHTKKAESPDDYGVNVAWSRNGTTGELDKSGDGECTFVITNFDSDADPFNGISIKGDYEAVINYKDDNTRFTITGITSDLTVTIENSVIPPKYSDTDTDTGSDTSSDTDTDNKVKLGDVDLDGKISAKDSMAIQRYAINLKKLNENQLRAADADGDNKATNKDAIIILRYTINIKVKYPIGEIV